MKNLTKSFLIVSILSTLGLWGLVRTVNANPSKPAVAVIDRNPVGTTQVSDEATESPATEKLEQQRNQVHHQAQVTSPSGNQTQENEPNESPNDSDGGAKEDAH